MSTFTVLSRKEESFDRPAIEVNDVSTWGPMRASTLFTGSLGMSLKRYSSFRRAFCSAEVSYRPPAADVAISRPYGRCLRLPINAGVLRFAKMFCRLMTSDLLG